MAMMTVQCYFKRNRSPGAVGPGFRLAAALTLTLLRLPF
jgi:hypothetical protein